MDERRLNEIADLAVRRQRIAALISEYDTIAKNGSLFALHLARYHEPVWLENFDKPLALAMLAVLRAAHDDLTRRLVECGALTEE